MTLLCYSPTLRSAFWLFVCSNQIPHIRIGRRKIMSSERAVRDWFARRTATGEA